METKERAVLRFNSIEEGINKSLHFSYRNRPNLELLLPGVVCPRFDDFFTVSHDKSEPSFAVLMLSSQFRASPPFFSVLVASMVHEPV